MVLTLWFSKKAKSVLKTSLDLSNQRNVRERFQPNFISIFLVKSFQSLNKVFINVIPKNTLKIIENRLNLKARVKFLTFQKGDVLKTHASVKSLFNKIKYKPNTNINNGIKEYVNWFNIYYGKTKKI